MKASALEPSPQPSQHLKGLGTLRRREQAVDRQLGTATIPRTRLDTSRLSPKPGPEYLLRANVEHERIFNAIERNDADAARRQMHRHLSDSQERLRRAYEAHRGSRP